MWTTAKPWKFMDFMDPLFSPYPPTSNFSSPDGWWVVYQAESTVLFLWVRQTSVDSSVLLCLPGLSNLFQMYPCQLKMGLYLLKHFQQMTVQKCWDFPIPQCLFHHHPDLPSECALFLLFKVTGRTRKTYFGSEYLWWWWGGTLVSIGSIFQNIWESWEVLWKMPLHKALAFAADPLQAVLLLECHALGVSVLTLPLTSYFSLWGKSTHFCP